MANDAQYGQFSRQAAAVMRSPYFSGQGDVSLARKRAKEQDVLQDALETADSYEELPKAARAVYDRARATLEASFNG